MSKSFNVFQYEVNSLKTYCLPVRYLFEYVTVVLISPFSYEDGQNCNGFAGASLLTQLGVVPEGMNRLP